MSKPLRYKALFIVAVILLCVFFVIGIPRSKEDLVANVGQNIRLGLDLKGGSHLVAQIQVQDAFEAEADEAMRQVGDEMTRQGISYGTMERNELNSIAEAENIQITIKGVPLDKTGAFRQIVTDRLSRWILTAMSSTDYRLNFKKSEAITLRKETLDRSVQTIQKRVDGLGLAEATVVPRGRADAESEVMIQMPGVDDPAMVKQVLGTAAVLEITEVKDGPFPGRDGALAKYNGVLPLNSKIVKSSGRGGDTADSYYVLARTPVVTGRDLRNARATRDEFGKWETGFTLSQDAAKRFGTFTQSNIGNRLAVVLDNQVQVAAEIKNRIEDNGVIQGQYSEQEAANLALVLRSGSLPAGLAYLQETTVGPSLGADSIRQGFQAGIAGLVAVVLVMLFYYRGAGINATLALMLNALVLIGVLAYFQAVLTLPGIAGIILLIGMAVDSNVLIFERIREEMRSGKAIAAAIDAGFGRAFLTIIDTHVTTVVSCAFLFLFGSGPVKGFAVTLVIGLIANVFTSVYVSRFLFDYNLSRNPRMEQLSI